MANQIRAGGMQRNVTPLATEGRIRRAQSGIEDIFDLEYVTRLFKNASIPDEKLVNPQGGNGGVTMTSVVSDYTISAPITLNGYTQVLLSGFSVPIPNCRLVLASIMVFGSAEAGDVLSVAANVVNTSQLVNIINSPFGGDGVISSGVIFLPTITNDRLRLFFNVDPSSPLIEVYIQIIGYIV